MFLFVNLFQHILIGMSLNLHISHQKISNLNVLNIESKFTFEKKKNRKCRKQDVQDIPLRYFIKAFKCYFFLRLKNVI